eukprot:Rhum_TRINITY_DN21222_c0_g1::Rhum_TRINITY_DN21222_c0_g1_i1::g.173526::m.173526
MTSHVIDSTFGGTRHHLRLADAAWGTLQACLNKQGAAHQTVAVTYVEDDEADELDDEVDVAWLALVLKEYAACHALLQGADADAADLVMCTAKQASPEERTALLAAFAGSDATFAVPTDSLLEADAAAGVDAAAFCVRLGFRGDTLAFPVPAAEHELCRLYLDATAGLALGDTEDAAPFAGSSLAPCDVALLRSALLAEETQPSAAETLALLDKRVREAEGAAAPHVVGHLLFNVAESSDDDALFSGLVQSQACYDYLADRNVPKRERVVVRDGRPVTYGSRVERAHRELCPKWGAARRAAFVAAMRERHAAAPAVDTGLLSDPVADAFAALFRDADAEGGAAAAPAAGAEGGAEEPVELTLDERFARAVERAKTLPSGLSNDNKLLLYAYFKQAQEGDCTKPKPGMLDFAGKAKWQAWVNVKGTSSDDAKRQYADACDAFAA